MSQGDDCHQSQFLINHYCNTHWNPPAYLFKNRCNFVLEWHSPLTCHTNTTNYERPCYIYDPKGNLIDLTPWVLSNGSSYEVETKETDIKKFSLNICNEAHDACGPNVSSCFVDAKHEIIESGFNNLTTISYNIDEKSVSLTSLGQYNHGCQAKRVKTVVKFVCDNRIVPRGGPKLVRSSDCENLIEWHTIHACALSEVKAPATDCRINYPALNLTIDLMALTNNKKIVQVPDLIIDGKQKTMLLSICQGMSKSGCEGKRTSATTACLIDNNVAAANRTAKNSRITGSIPSSSIRFADDRLYLESSAVNRSCTFTTGRNLTIARQLTTRIEFFCAKEPSDKPTFLGFNECTYVFEWGSPKMCLEEVASQQSAPVTVPTQIVEPPSNKVPARIDSAEKPKSGSEKNRDTLADANKALKPPVAVKDNSNEGIFSSSTTTTTTTETPKVAEAIAVRVPVPEPRMNSVHKFFMIASIVMSLVAFIVVIFILDKKTHLGIPVRGIMRRHVRQAFQAQPVPYSRVDSFGDSLVL